MIYDLQAADFDVSLTGFEAAELDDLFKDDIKNGVKDDDFDVDAELKKPCMTRRGDLWKIGRHRLYCGDSTDEKTYDLLMGGTRANLVVTDPPYNVNYEGSAGKIKNDNMANDDFYQFLLAAFTNMEQVMTDNASIDSTSAKRSAMRVFICPGPASGRSKALFWADLRTSGSMNPSCSAGRRLANMSGTRDGRNQRSGSSISRRRTQIIRP